jgi:hypothetical protein
MTALDGTVLAEFHWGKETASATALESNHVGMHSRSHAAILHAAKADQ